MESAVPQQSDPAASLYERIFLRLKVVLRMTAIGIILIPKCLVFHLQYFIAFSNIADIIIIGCEW